MTCNPHVINISGARQLKLPPSVNYADHTCSSIGNLLNILCVHSADRMIWKGVFRINMVISMSVQSPAYRANGPPCRSSIPSNLAMQMSNQLSNRYLCLAFRLCTWFSQHVTLEIMPMTVFSSIRKNCQTAIPMHEMYCMIWLPYKHAECTTANFLRWEAQSNYQWTQLY